MWFLRVLRDGALKKMLVCRIPSCFCPCCFPNCSVKTLSRGFCDKSLNWKAFRRQKQRHDVCICVKGNVFKNKCVLMESIHKSKAEKAREKTLSDQFEAKRAKNKASRERKHATRDKRLAKGPGGDVAPAAAPAFAATT